MRQIAYKILTLAMAITILVVTTGVSIFKHDCVCKNKVITSIFTEHTCHNTPESTTSSSCNTGSCSIPKHNTHQPHSAKSCGCKTVEVSLKLNERFTIPMQASVPQIEFFKAIIVTLFHSQLVEQAVPSPKWEYAESPPPLSSYGKALLFALHQIKIPTPFCS